MTAGKRNPPVQLGQTFGTWTIVRIATPALWHSKLVKRYWRCECSCGEARDIAEGNLGSLSAAGCKLCAPKQRLDIIPKHRKGVPK